MTPNSNRLAFADVEKAPNGFALDLMPLRDEEPFRVIQTLSSGRMLLGPFSREDMRTLRDSLTMFLKGQKR